MCCPLIRPDTQTAHADIGPVLSGVRSEHSAPTASGRQARTRRERTRCRSSWTGLRSGPQQPIQWLQRGTHTTPQPVASRFVTRHRSFQGRRPANGKWTSNQTITIPEKLEIGNSCDPMIAGRGPSALSWLRGCRTRPERPSPHRGRGFCRERRGWQEASPRVLESVPSSR